MWSELASVDLPDVNVWLALSAPEHPHHERAVEYWQTEAAQRIAFCSLTMLGLMRLLCNTAALGPQPLTPLAAWEVCQRWCADHAVFVAHEPRRSYVALHSLVVDGLVRPRTWTDAYLAAFAGAGQLRLVSFDSDFANFPNLDWLHLA